MIRGMFCHDLPIYKDINGVYCSTTLTDDLFKRYFHVVDKLVVAVRVFDLDTTYEEAHQEKITIQNVEFLEFTDLNKIGSMLTGIPKAKKKLVNAMRDVDLIFIRGGIIASLGVQAARKLKKPYLFECAACAWDAYWYHSLIGKMIAPYMEWNVKRNVRDAAFVVYVTKKWLQSRYPAKGESTNASNVVLNSIEDKALADRLEKIKNKPDGEEVVFGTTAFVDNKTKGQHFVLEAMHRLGDKYNIRYELVGSGEPKYLKSLIAKYHLEDKVIFKGVMSHNEVLSWLDSIDVYIQPSLQEGLPRSVIEAMSRGCPVIGSTTAGIPELLQEDALFERGQVDKLVERIESYLKSDFSERAEYNFNKSKEYHIDRLNERRSKLYEKYRDFVINNQRKK